MNESISGVRRGRAARWAGGVLLALGVGALVAVFALAAALFAELPRQVGDTRLVAARGVGGILAEAAVRAVFLLVMTHAGSLIASKGIELLRAGEDREKP